MSICKPLFRCAWIIGILLSTASVRSQEVQPEARPKPMYEYLGESEKASSPKSKNKDADEDFKIKIPKVPRLIVIVQNGQLAEASFSDSERYCKAKGMRLPTPIELAAFARKSGAKIYAKPTSSKSAVGIGEFDHSGRWLTYFYYDASEYVFPAEPENMSTGIFWTTLVSNWQAYAFNGRTGQLDLAMASSSMNLENVICAK